MAKTLDANGQLFATALEAVLVHASRLARGTERCDECEAPIEQDARCGYVLAVRRERDGWNYDVLHTLCDRQKIDAEVHRDIEGDADCVVMDR